jgi:hypothetical protein
MISDGTEFNGYVLTSDSNGLASWTAANIGDAATLDTLDSTQFLRSDTSDSYTSGTLTFDAATTVDIDSTTLRIADTDITLDGASTTFTQTTGSINFTPAVGQDLNINLNSSGNFVVNPLAGSLTVDGNSGHVGIGVNNDTLQDLYIVSDSNQAILAIQLEDEDYYAQITFSGIDGNGDGLRKWYVGANGDTRPGSHGGGNTFYIFQRTNKYDASVNGYRMVIDDNGVVGINTFNPSTGVNLEVSSVIKSTPTDTPGACNTDTHGGMYYDTSMNKPCYCNGINWLTFDTNSICT